MRVDRSMADRAPWATTTRSRRDVVKTMLVAGGAVVFAGYGKAPAAAQGNVRLVQWYHQYGEEGTQDAVQRYAEEYTAANPGVEVEVVWVLGDYTAKLNAALLTEEGPDVFEGGPTVAMVKQNQVVPLDDIFTPEEKADFDQRAIAQNTINGQLYAVKMVMDIGLLYYRRSILEEAGVTPPTTMDEVIASAQALDSGRVKGLFLGNDGGITALQDVAPWSAGSDFLVDNQIVFNNERTALAYDKVRQLSQSGSLLIGAPTDWWDPSAFTQNLTAMQWTGLWAMPGIRAVIGDDFGVVPWPALDAQGRPATFLGGWSQMVNGNKPNIDAAKQFVKSLWVQNTAAQQDWNLSYGFHLPPRASIQASAEPLKEGPPAEAVTFLADYGKYQPPQWTGAMGTAVLTALSNIVKNNADIAAELTTAQQACEQELAQVLA